MPQQSPLELAKQGDPISIAVLINHNIKPKGITAKVSRKDDCLRIMLESNQVPNQDNLIEFVRNGILKLGIVELNTLQVLGRKVGDQAPAWSQTISLKMPSSSLTNQEVISEPQDVHSHPAQTPTSSSQKNNIPTAQNSNLVPNSGGDANPDVILLREAAQKGDLQAISSLIGRAIAPRNIKVDAIMQDRVTLWLKIYPLATMQPQSCIQAVTSILNDIQPGKIHLVRVSEISSDKKTQVWNRFLALKNGKVVDKTTSLNIRLGVVVVLIIGLVGYCALPKQATTYRTATSTSPASGQEQSQLQQGEWYEGGTLHNAGALEWQQASYENKLATCADFVSSMWEEKSLKPSIQNQIKSMDDIRTLAQELVTQMDAAMEEKSNPEENEQIYANQKVSDIAVILMLSMNWLK
ncbi:hypothetical protein [Leptolyngbya sp. CCY15150]|uniref:hypothetical protein n=1 Tax=Leptolyngbya sp. CCY15150 TaxID=2767772 RepID=UPI0019512E1E|nr:hypothetical protein [Leptolyngbya sp. CCY15150]